MHGKRNSYCNSGPGCSAYNGAGAGPSRVIITGVRLAPDHQLLMP